MIYIKKERVPKAFLDAKRERKIYDELDGEIKDKLKGYLIKEQGGLCAYCMSRITMNNSTIEHYITRHGEHGDMKKSLDYNNMFAVCTNERNTRKKAGHCDVSRGNKPLTIDPRNKSHILQLKYKRDGEIYSDNTDFYDDLNKTLKLNIITLKRNRKAARDSALVSMSKANKNSWKEEFVSRQIKKLEGQVQKTEYIGIIIYELSKRLKRNI